MDKQNSVASSKKEKQFEFCVKMAVIIKEMMSGSENLGENGKEEAE